MTLVAHIALHDVFLLCGMYYFFRVSSSYFFLFFEHIPIFSYLLNETSYFSYFLAGEANVCYKIENEIIVMFQMKIQDKASSNISLLYICKIFFCSHCTFI